MVVARVCGFMNAISEAKLRGYASVMLGAALLFCGLSCHDRQFSSTQPETLRTGPQTDTEASDPLPPDLSRCTRLEIRLEPSVLEWVAVTKRDQGLLNKAEHEYLRSLGTFIVRDQEQIRAFARELMEAPYKGASRPPVRMSHFARVACFRDSQHLISFTVRGAQIQTEKGQEFWSEEVWGGIGRFLPELHPLQRRVLCGQHLSRLHRFIHFYTRSSKDNEYPPPEVWCDTILAWGRTHGRAEEYMISSFKCPGAHEEKSGYAMNPNCRADSPSDMVLLFEAEGGWNQHGGPELFTFTHHEPPGGNVRLKDGTVKFIRTEEELRQLRW